MNLDNKTKNELVDKIIKVLKLYFPTASIEKMMPWIMTIIEDEYKEL